MARGDTPRLSRRLIRKLDAIDRAPAYLYAAPGIAWWLTWLWITWEFRRMDQASNPLGASVIAGLPLLLLALVAAVFGLASLLLLRIPVGYRLALLAINLSGPVWMSAG